ncbi:lipoprotein [Flavobacterium enshiense DK69]|uniref:DUF4382 domain-containing protein n=1 Tax=Flavobacterium enshiense DK69 TaxID=1107311 RepID=V6SBF5_9FLAO|nr:DUF4382 domain-containing protein [Flavobacterium enshiense]ESU23971.1 lipoprotein [Flavobacterium enshiense DK69]KGO96239.1 hypothetical protein Q767_08285 [Flavobacterium enshiense DK69]
MKILKNCMLAFFTMACISALLVSCNDNDDSQVSGTSKITVRMTDAPGDYDEVNVEVVDVEIKSPEGGWMSIGNNPGVYNLLDLTGGVSVILADSIVPSGHLGQMRLILGQNNTVVKDGVSYPLRTPSAQQSGLKLQINQTLEPDFTYNFLLDFDVQHSVVVEAGNSGNYNLHPVIRVTTEAASGAIKGTVEPIDVPTEASVMVNGVLVTANTDDLGVFQLNGIPSGTYAVTLTPDPASGHPVLVVDNVVVVNGQITNMGTIALP